MKDPKVVREIYKMLDGDITYCVSKSCPKADKCDRWWMNHFVESNKTISMFDPYKKGKKCVYFKTI
jgi:hypothetical protein